MGDDCKQIDTLNPNLGENDTRNKSTLDLATDYEHLSVTGKENLNSIFEEIVTKAAVDFNNSEIQDIKSAVSEMIERIKIWINERGVFSISRTELCGSFAEEEAMWKHDPLFGQPYIEMDFLAVLQPAGDTGIKRGCQECFCVDTLPANISHNIPFYDLHGQKHLFEKCFKREKYYCLTSCGCLKVMCHSIIGEPYNVEPSTTCSKTQQSCDKCTVDRPTGTLQAKPPNSMVGVVGNSYFIFEWKSKAKALCTRDSNGLPQTEKMDNFAIHVDFLPALELFQSKQQSAAACFSSDFVLIPTSSEYQHYCFLVPKHCVVCDTEGLKGKWRRSGCQAEIDTFKKKMSNKHHKCYQVFKHLGGLGLNAINSYLIKIAILHHNSSCSDAGEDCAKCVFTILDELQHAYKSGQLKSFHSQANLLKLEPSFYCKSYSDGVYGLKKAMCSAVPESDSLPSFLDKVNSIVFSKYILNEATNR